MDQFDVTLEDSELLAEVQLTADLMVAAGECADAMSQDRIDAVLGVRPRRPAEE